MQQAQDAVARVRLRLASPLRARVGMAVDIEQMRGIHLRIDLRRGKAGMAEQLLQRAQIRAAPEQMGRETVAQGMGGGALRQAQAPPRAPHRPANNGGGRGAPPRAPGEGGRPRYWG